MGSTAPLIGIDDLETPYWAQSHEVAARAGTWAVARTAPRTLAVLAWWSWRAAPGLTAVALAAHLLTAVTTAFGLLATAPVFASVLAAGTSPQALPAAVPALAVVVGAVVLRGVLQTVAGAVQAELTPRIELHVQDDLFAGLVEVDLVAFDEPDFTTLVERVATETLISIRYGATLLGDLVGALVGIVAALVAAVALHPLLAPLVLVAALPQAWAILRSAQVQMAANVRMNSGFHRRDVTGRLIAGREHAGEIRASGAGRVLLGEHRRIAAALVDDAVRTGRRRAAVAAAGRALSGSGAALGYLALGALLHTGQLPLALAASAVLAMRTAAQALGTAVHTVNQMLEVGLHADLYQECLADVRRRRRAQATQVLAGGPARIDLDRVSFRYPGQNHHALHDITLTLRRGEVVALVGENGSGKTTLAKLVTGLYLPSSGTVCWDGVDVRDVCPDQLWDRVAMVMQEPLRWPATAENNVRIGRLDRSDPHDAAFADAVARSGAGDVLADLPAGPATVLSRQFQGGRDLSGGQWQRIGVARGLYRDAPVVVADEPTAAMDAHAEQAAFAALRSLAEGDSRIVVLVTHRLANVRHADQIVVMRGGGVVEIGTHDELMTHRGPYHEMFSMQSDAFALDGDRTCGLLSADRQ